MNNEYVSKITIFGLKIMVKSGLNRKNIFESPPCGKPFFWPTDLLYKREDTCPKLQIR